MVWSLGCRNLLIRFVVATVGLAVAVVSANAENPVDSAARWDPQFGIAAGCDGGVFAILPLPDGRIVVGGSFRVCGNVAVRNIALWSPVNGGYSALGNGASNGVSDSVRALVLHDGEVFAGGFFTEAGGVSAPYVARFDLASGSWAGLGAGLNGIVWDLETSGTVLYAGGRFTQAGGQPASRIAAWDLVAQSWSSLGSGASDGVNDAVRAVEVFQGSVVVGGEFTTAGGAPASRVARYAPTTGWSALSGVSADGVDGIVSAFASTPSTLFVGGGFSTAGGVAASDVAAYRPGNAAAPWAALGGPGAQGIGGGGSVAKLAYMPSDNSILVGGTFDLAGGLAANNIARFGVASETWSTLGAGTNGSVISLAGAGSDVVVGGLFTQAGGGPAISIARLATGTLVWTSLGTGPSNGIRAGTFTAGVSSLLAHGGGVYAGGELRQAGEVLANSVARFAPANNTWSPLGAGESNGLTSSFGSALATTLSVSGGEVFAGGTFDQAGGAFASDAARYNIASGVWSAFSGGGLDSGANASAAAGQSVYFGGNIFNAGSIPVRNAARFDLATGAWESLGTGPSNGTNNLVFAMAPQDPLSTSSPVYVGGAFSEAGGVAMRRLGRYDPATRTWSPVGTPEGTNGTIRALLVRGGFLYLGGDFSEAGGITALRVARVNLATGVWSSLGTGAENGVDNRVHALAAFDTDIYVGGDFVTAGTRAASYVARFDTLTGTWHPLGSGSAQGVDSLVRALAVIDRRNVFMGGFFRNAGGKTSLRIARYDSRRSATAALTSAPSPSAVVNNEVLITANVATQGFPAVPGTVAFLADGALIPGCAAVAFAASGQDAREATCRTATLATGSRRLVARYAGDDLNFVATSPEVTLQVLPPTFAFGPETLPPATFAASGYASGTIAVSAAPGTGILGPVTFQVVNAAQLPPGLTATPQANGLVITGTPTQAGTFNFTVRAADSSTTTVGGPFSSDRQYTIVVARAPQTIGAITRVDAQPLDNGVAFADGNFAVQAVASSALPVVIDSTTPTVCQVGAPGSTVQPLQIGTCTLRARQAGNANYEPAAELLRSFQVKATPVVSLVSAPNPSLWRLGEPLADPVTLTATVEGSQPGGLVRFQRGANTIPDCPPESLLTVGDVGTEACDTTRLPRGTNMLVVQYLGDQRNLADTSNVIAHQINVVTATDIASIAPSPCVIGQACTVTVTMRAGNGVPTGPVQVSASTGGSCTITLTSNGGSCVLTATAAGSGTVSATYLGSPPWLASPAATQVHPFVATVDELFGNGFEPAVAAPQQQ